MEKGDGMKKVFKAMVFISLMVLIGIVGSVEQEIIPLGTGIAIMAVGILSFWLFTWLSGMFEYSRTSGKDKESRPRSGSPKDGKRKSLI